MEYYRESDRVVSQKDWENYLVLLKRRARREPVAYITGQKEFWGLNLQINRTVLIPRPETELLVEETLRILSRTWNNIRIWEIGTGSGAVAISLAREIRGASIYASDISIDALHLARENARIHKVEDRIRFFCGDMFLPIKVEENFFTLILSNPPYLSQEDWENVPLDVSLYEPEAALCGGDDGLLFYRRFFPEVFRYLKDDGSILLEIGEKQGEILKNLAIKSGQFSSIEIIKDLSGKDRIIAAKMDKKR